MARDLRRTIVVTTCALMASIAVTEIAVPAYPAPRVATLNGVTARVLQKPTSPAGY